MEKRSRVNATPKPSYGRACLRDNMDAIIDPADPTAAQAMEALASMEADANPAPVPTPEATESATPEPPAPTPESGITSAEAAEPKGSDDTPTTAESSQEPAKSKPEVKETKSSYARSIERGFTNWKEFNEWKAGERARIEAEKAAIQAERQALQTQKPPEMTPDTYRTWAEQTEARSALLEKRATAAEDAGNFDQAEKLREEAAELKIDARRAYRKAEELTANPPPTTQQQAAQVEATKREWYSKAQIDFPNAAKPGTPESEALTALLTQNPDIAAPQNAEQMYWACRLVTGETAAARVPTLTKQVSDLTAKIKELEGKLAIPSDDTVHRQNGNVPFAQMSQDDQFAQLEREARGMQERI